MSRSDEIITVTVSEYLSLDLAKKIAAAQWERPEWFVGIRFSVYANKTESDCFNVTAQNEFGELVGRLFCIRNDKNQKLWYYGDLFVIPKYRRRHIAEKMISAASEALKDRSCEAVRVYIDPENTPSLDLHRKLGFSEKPYQPFNSLFNDGQKMFEKQLGAVYEAIPAATSNDAKYINYFFAKNIEALHCKIITYSEWCKALSEKCADEKHFLICRGVMPVAWLKLNGLANGGAGWVSMLVVEPTFQHKGVGRFAMKFAENFMISKGKHKIKVQTTEDNAAALSLYKKCGFAVEEKHAAIAYDDHEVVIVTLGKEI